jgi:excisionase family DNA binding protein
MNDERFPKPEATALLDVRAVARLLNCSPRHVYRLVDAGRMPRPVKLGSLCRWCRDELDEWIAGGCKAVRTVTAKKPNHSPFST